TFPPHQEIAIAFGPRAAWPGEFADFEFLHPDPDDFDVSKPYDGTIQQIRPEPCPRRQMRLISQVQQGSPVAKVRIHPDGERIVSCSKERDDCRLWAGDSGWVRLIARYGTGAPEGRPQYFVSTPRGRYEGGYCHCVGDVTFHPDGETMALAGIGRP